MRLNQLFLKRFWLVACAWAVFNGAVGIANQPADGESTALAQRSSVPLKPSGSGGLETEPGLRLRLFSIGERFDASRPLRPGQSPNLDITVPEPTIDTERPELIGENDETYLRFYIVELSGWLRADRAGTYGFDARSDAEVEIRIDEQLLTNGRVQLQAGWHRLEVRQAVQEPDQRPLALRWQPPGTTEFMAIPLEALAAPAFYFRPTQAGKKEMSNPADRPGLGQKVAGVHPGYRVVDIRPAGMTMPVGGLGILSDGRLVVARFDATTLRAPRPTESPNGQIWLLSTVNSKKPDETTAELIADGLFEPSGVCVLNDVIYVSQRSEITRLTFNRSTGRWNSKSIASGWETNDFHQISAGLPHLPGPTHDHPGYLFVGRGTGLGLQKNPPNHGSVWRIDLSQPEGDNVTPLTGGHRTPNGLGLNETGELFVIDNQGNWTPANELNHVQQGHFYGYYQPNNPPQAYPSPFQPADIETGVVTEAAVLLPQDEIGNSPTQPLLFPADHQFAGQLALPDMRYGGINRVFLEEVDGQWQGCAMRFTQGLDAGPNRILWGPDGSLYVGGIGGRHASTWYWDNEHDEPTYHGLERLVPTGKEVFEIHNMRATPDGFLLTFTQPVNKAFLENPANYRVSEWTYTATRQYGGPKIDPHQLQVASAKAADDGCSVRLAIPSLKAGYVVHLRTDPVSVPGEEIWSGDIWYTLNQIPAATNNP